MKVLLVSEGKHEDAGALDSLVRRLLSGEAEVIQDRVSRSDLHVHHGKGPGYFKRAVAWMREAQRQGFDALVLLIDEDHRPERITEITHAQAELRVVQVRRALGTAIHAFDAWMLADERCLSHVLDCTVQRQPDPEATADPKSACKALLRDSQSEMSQAQMCAAVAAAMDLATLEERCPRGFAPFAQRVRAL